MSQEKFDNEKEIRRFLLGEMSEDERTAFEERFLAEDGTLFDQIAVIEDELIEAYIRGTLDGGEKAKFERGFLTTESRRRRVEFTREMLAQLAARRETVAKKTATAAENTPVLNWLINLLKTPRLAFATAFALLLLGFGFWFLVLRDTENRREITRQTTPTPAASPTPQDQQSNQNPPLDSNVNAPAGKTPTANTSADNLNKVPPPNTALKPVVATITLFAGTSRAEGRTSELALTKETRNANFRLDLENRDYKTYRAEIVDGEGNVIYRSGKITARSSRINAFFPTAKLKKGDYLIKLYGFNPSGAEESAADFQFRVTQK